MRDIQEIYNELEANKKEQKEIRREYKDALQNANEYTETEEEYKKIKEKKKQIENITQSRMGGRWDTFEKLKARAKELEEAITDVAMSTLMDGKTVAVKDQYDNSYEPVYKITFRRIT
jgi:L-fucose isomerase-like protein